jgi:hypothetical protein
MHSKYLLSDICGLIALLKQLYTTVHSIWPQGSGMLFLAVPLCLASGTPRRETLDPLPWIS